MLTGALTRSSSDEEGWTDTNAYWEPLLLRKAEQTPSSFTEEGLTDTNVTGSSLLRKAGQIPILTGKLFC